jgi:superfamily II DNA or RNA helicase
MSSKRIGRRELRSEAIAVERDYGKLIGAIRARETDLQEQIRQLVRKRVNTRVARRLAQTTLAQADEPGHSIGLSSLRRAGLVTLLDAYRWRGSLEQIDGIGPVKAKRIRERLKRVAAPIPEDGRLYSDPSLWDETDVALVRALIQLQKIKEAKASSDVFERSSELIKIAEVLRSKTGPITSLMKSAREEARVLWGEMQLVAPPLTRAQMRSELELVLPRNSSASGIPESDQYVVNQWRANSARLLALLDRVAPNMIQVGRGSTDSLPIGAPGNLPEAIQQRIEETALDLTGFKRDLRTYQSFGARFALAAEGVILGDEMGLGKTIQAIAIAHHLSKAQERVRVLVVAPVSILENWRREINDSTNLRPFVLHGPDRDSRTEQWEREGGIALTSYQTLGSLPFSSELELDLMVVDEAHKIKNPRAAQTRAAFHHLRRSRYRLLLSGTPLENRTSEFMFLLWVVNKSLGESLKRQFGDGSSAHLEAAKFRKLVAPGYLRRNQEDVLSELPELLLTNEMVMEQNSEFEVYRTALRQRHYHAARQATTIGKGSESAKMKRLRELLNEYSDNDEKVLVFSTYRKVLDTVMEVAGNGSIRMDGNVPYTARQGLIDDFSSSPGFAVLAMNPDVGGVGLNIQAASVVIIIEPQLKPSTEWQAIRRAHRMGQTRRVTVHRLLAANTIDERIEQRLLTKQRIFDATVGRSQLAEEMDEATATALIADEARRLHVNQE